MKVTVKHKNFDTGMFDCVAEVDVTELYSLSRMDQLEYAYRWTNNIDGSWSRKIGGDANEAVTVLMTREDGRGLRSTMMFDRMEIDGVEYEVAACGFERVAA